MLDGMGIETGIDFEKLLSVSRFINGYLNRSSISKVAAAFNQKHRLGDE